jgi:peptidyl-prolyl cis-trans isomerase D
MLLEIREKVQGVFASIVLVFICVLFGLWGIQNYLGGGKESPIVSVNDRDFFQNEVNHAYQQFAQNLGGMKFDEEMVRNQALQKLVRDEVLLQAVEHEKLLISDDSARDFIKTLEYFQKDGQFDKAQYQTLLSSQGMSSDEFVGRIKKALVMDQFQRAIVDSSFVSTAAVDAYFKIQNQRRDVEYVTVPKVAVKVTPTDDEITSYYQQHVDAFQTEEQASIQYVELSLEQLANGVATSDEQLKSFYDDQKSQFSTPERRKISHILFAFTKDTSADKQALERALQAKEALKKQSFAAVAAQLSDDKLTASKGGDLGLFSVGVMEKAFEDAASKLKLGEVSEPVKSAFGYHLITVTELTAGEAKPFEAVKADIKKAYQKAQAENQFNTLAEKLAQVSYENPDSLDAAASMVNADIKTSAVFTRSQGEGIAQEEKVRLAAFSEDVLKGANSEPVEAGVDKLVVLRIQSHQPATSRPLTEVKNHVVELLVQDKARQLTEAKAEQIRAEVAAGSSLTKAAEADHLTVKQAKALARNGAELPLPLNQAIFKAPKPQNGVASVITIEGADGSKHVAVVTKVSDGAMTEGDKAKQVLIQNNMAAAVGKAHFEAVLNALQSKADVVVRAPKS